MVISHKSDDPMDVYVNFRYVSHANTISIAATLGEQDFGHYRGGLY